MVEVFRAIIIEHTVCPCINFSGQLAICTVTSFYYYDQNSFHFSYSVFKYGNPSEV